jgi:predicted DNA-binding mobile mystery protein A
MIDKMKRLQIKTLDLHIEKIHVCDRPAKGWISTIRKALSMSASQFAHRIGISQQAATRLEANENNDTITLKSLRKVAAALDCKLVYAFIPNKKSLEKVIEKQAIKKAKELIDPVDHTMMLEGQKVENKSDKIKEIANDLIQNLNSKMWD